MKNILSVNIFFFFLRQSFLQKIPKKFCKLWIHFEVQICSLVKYLYLVPCWLFFFQKGKVISHDRIFNEIAYHVLICLLSSVCCSCKQCCTVMCYFLIQKIHVSEGLFMRLSQLKQAYVSFSKYLYCFCWCIFMKCFVRTKKSYCE